jgi:hypothetical protein
MHRVIDRVHRNERNCGKKKAELMWHIPARPCTDSFSPQGEVRMDHSLKNICSASLEAYKHSDVQLYLCPRTSDPTKDQRDYRHSRGT